MDLENVLRKKRLTHDEKSELAQIVISKALKVIKTKGKFIDVDNLETKPVEAKVGDLTILFSTPFTKLPGLEQYLIDIWCANHGKVFSARWGENYSNLELISLRKGGWCRDLHVS